jgi:hypothetical protein
MIQGITGNDRCAEMRCTMSRNRKNLPQELKSLQNRLRELLRASMDESLRTAELLRETERKIEDRFGHISSLETTWEIAARKFRKRPNLNIASPQLNRLPQSTSNFERQTSNIE